MTPEERRRAGLAVAARILQMGSSVPTVARDAGLSANTVRALINGANWPRRATRDRLTEALGWPPGEVQRRAMLGDVRLAEFTVLELLREVCRRIEGNPSILAKLEQSTIFPDTGP